MQETRTGDMINTQNAHDHTLMSLNVLIVEDDALFRDSLCDILNIEGFTAYGVGSVAAYRSWSSLNSPDVLILDRNLPDGDGLTVLALQKQRMPVPTIFVTCEGQAEDRVLGLDADADYYLVKPIDANELVAVLNRIKRRIITSRRDVSEKWVIDKNRWRLIWPNNACHIPLTRSEMSILSCFTNKADIHVARGEIAEALGNNPINYDFRRLEVIVRRLRSKAREAAGSDIPLLTAYGKGYVFNAQLDELTPD